MNSTKLGSIATGVLVVCAITLTALLIKRELRPPPNRNVFPQPRIQRDWQAYAVGGHVLGRTDAPVTIIEFADFECPVCRRFESYVDSLRLLGKEFRIVYRHFPLPMHRFAIPAVRASECASEQGRFEETHNAIYQYADSIGLVSWWWLASKGGVLDSVRFHQCMQSTLPLAALARDTVEGKRLGITGTPTILVGQLRLDGLYPFDSISAYIDRAAAHSP